MRHQNLLTDLRAVSRLAIHATAGVTHVVEGMHRNIAHAPSLVGRAPTGRARGVAGIVYASVRGVTRAVGVGIDGLLAPLAPLLGDQPSSAERDAWVAALNGVLGDHLADDGNPLAIPMRLRRGGAPLAAAEVAGRRVLLLLHGLAMNDRQWSWRGHDHGALLARDLDAAPVYLQYNSGRHISTNGRELAELLETAAPAELYVVGFSMGGLVARSALHHAERAGHAWPGRVRAAVFLGTPHHGAPLERGGHLVDRVMAWSPYSAPLGGLGKIRSAGITDLRHGSLVDDDWLGRDRFAPSEPPAAVPLPPGLSSFAIAASRATVGLVGDGLVPVPSALGDSDDPARSLGLPEDRRHIVRGSGHLGLLGSRAAYERMRDWLKGA